LKRFHNINLSLEEKYLVREIGLEYLLIHHDYHKRSYTVKTKIDDLGFLLESLPPKNYFTMTNPFVSKLLVSHKNFSDIVNVADRFPSGLTDFLGFECHLNGNEVRTDWALAISGEGNSRCVLADLLNDGDFTNSFFETYEWTQIREFARVWANQNSILYNTVLGAWLEFDMLESLSSIPVPSVFFNPANVNGYTAGHPAKYEWFTQSALPILLGRPLTKIMRCNVNKCIQKMPVGASLFIVGVMLSRKTSDIRMSVLFRDSREIMPYLDEIGWSDDETKELDANKVNRMVLDFDVGKQIGKKIAIECSFFPNRYYEEKNWGEFIFLLTEKGLITSDKRNALLKFPGAEYNGSLARYITHVKIIYERGQPLKAKAYLAIRHFLDAGTTMMKR
jgi:hypothetical protein